AEPAASSVGVLNLLLLSHLGLESTRDGDGYAERIEFTLGGFSTRAAQAGRTVPMMLAALSSDHAGIPQVVLVGNRDTTGASDLLREVRTRYRPTLIQLIVGSDHRESIAHRLPWVGALRERNGHPTAYLCREFACQAPTTEADELARQLDGG